MTVRISSEMAGELDKLAASCGEKRSDCVRSLISEGLLRRSEGAYVPLVAQAVRREMDAPEERIAARFAAVEDSNDESLRMLGALLWLSSFDEHRDEGGQMDAWLRLALFESGKVLNGERLDDTVGLDRLAGYSARGENKHGSFLRGAYRFTR